MSKVIFLDIDGVLNNSNHTLKLVKLLGENQYYLLNLYNFSSLKHLQIYNLVLIF